MPTGLKRRRRPYRPRDRRRAEPPGLYDQARDGLALPVRGRGSQGRRIRKGAAVRNKRTVKTKAKPPKRDQAWFERKVAELGRALDKLRPDRQEQLERELEERD